MNPRLLALVIFAACKSAEPEQATPFVSTDVRLDSAPEKVHSYGPSMCTTPEGTVAVAWVEERTVDVPTIWFNRSTDGGATWLPEALDLSRTPKSADNPSLVCDGQTVIAVWEDTRDGELGLPNIWLSRSTDAGASWDEPRRIEVDTYGRYASRMPRIAMVGSNVYVAWMDQLYGAYDVFFTASADGGGTFSEPIRLDGDLQGEAYSGFPVLRANGSQIAVAWEDQRSGAADVYYTRSLDGGLTWELARTDNPYPTDPAGRIDGGDAPGYADSQWVDLALNDLESVVVWHDQRDGEGFGVYFNRAGDGVTFAQAATRLDGAALGMFDSLYPQVAFANGAAHVIWQDDRLGDLQVYYRAIAGGVPGAELAVNHGASGTNAFEPRLAVSEAGVAVAWRDTRNDTRNENDDVYYNYSADFGATWSEEDLRLNSTAGGITFSTDLALGLIGDELTAAWADGREGTADVYFHDLLLGEQAPTPDSQ